MGDSRKTLHGQAMICAPSTTAEPSSLIDSSLFTHTPCYCEENVYLLCKKLSAVGIADPLGRDLFVVFISNEKKKVPLWYQKASKRTDGLVIWDYHVICIQSRRDGETCTDLVWDLDSTLPFPYPLKRYCTEAFQPDSQLSSMFNRLFRVVRASSFLCNFASDRSHMRDPHGNWHSPPPKYESIIAEDGAVNNLDEYLRMSAGDITTDVDTLVRGVYSSKFGMVINEQMLEGFFLSDSLIAKGQLIAELVWNLNSCQ